MIPTEAEMGLGLQVTPIRSHGHSRKEKANFRGVLGHCNCIILLNLSQQTFEVDIIIPILQMKILKSNLELYLDFRTLPNWCEAELRLKVGFLCFYTTLCLCIL